MHTTHTTLLWHSKLLTRHPHKVGVHRMGEALKVTFLPTLIPTKLNFGMVHMGSQILCPTYVVESQHGGKVPTLEPQETIKIWLIIIKAQSLLLSA
jgi:hypothetical protein